MNTGREKKREKVHECVGGPLCGVKLPFRPKFVYLDDDGRPHYYRIIKVMKTDHSAVAVFYHYFGTSKRWANKAHPYLLPGERAYRPTI